MKTVLFLLLVSLPLIGNAQEKILIESQEQAENVLQKVRQLSMFNNLDSAFLLLNQIEHSLLDKFGNEHDVTANFYGKKAICQAMSGNIAEAALSFENQKNVVLKIYGNQHPEYASCLSSLGNVKLTTGLFEEAESMFKEAKKIFEENQAENHPSYGATLYRLGNLYSYLDYYEAALPLLLKTTEMDEATYGKMHPHVAGDYGRLGGNYQLLGEYKQAEYYSSESVKIWEQLFGKSHPEYLGALVNYSVLKSDLGQYDMAIEMLNEVKNTFENQLQDRTHRYYQTCLGNLGDNYMKKQDYGKAETLYDDLLGFDTEQNKSTQRLTILRNLAYVYYLTDRLDKAENTIFESISISQDLYKEDNENHAANLMTLANIYLGQNRFQEAETKMLQGLEMLTKVLGPNNLEVGKARIRLASNYLYLNKDERAVESLIQAINIFEDNIRQRSYHTSEVEMQNYLAQFKKRYNTLFSFNSNISSPDLTSKSFNSALFYKGFLLENSLKIENLKSNASPEWNNTFNEWRFLHRQLAKEYSKPLKHRGDTEKMKIRINEIEKILISDRSNFSENQKSVSWQDVQNTLKEGEAVIEFIEYKFVEKGELDSVICSALILKPDFEAPLFVPLFGLDQLGNLRAIRRLYSSTNQSNRINLNELIWRHLEKHLTDVHTIHYSPSGTLHRINFGAIPVSETETVSDKFALQNMGSSRLLVTPSQLKKSENDAVIFGGINYDTPPSFTDQNNTQENSFLASRNLEDSFRSLRGDNWGYLEWTEKEATEIQTILENNGTKVTLHVGLDASEEAFKNIGRGKDSPQILHLATHGYFFPDVDTSSTSGFRASNHPMIRSGLILAGANEAWKGNSTNQKEDGILTAYEISQMNLSNTELVVLSACDTGLGDIEGNEGVYGLQRAFKIAGAKYLLMSLWKVNDAEAYEFMTTFYKEWKENEKTIPQAYQAAQSYMRSLQPNNPRSWAGFVLVE